MILDEDLKVPQPGPTSTRIAGPASSRMPPFFETGKYRTGSSVNPSRGTCVAIGASVRHNSPALPITDALAGAAEADDPTE